MNKAIIVIIIIIVGGLGYWAVSILNSTPKEETEELTLSQEEALAIAQQSSDCSMTGILTDTINYNAVTKTWWIDLERMPELEKDGCNPACVVNEETKTAEVNWRCTGLLLETEDETIDCKTDFDCFIEASRICRASKVNFTKTMNIFGVKQETTEFYEIKGLELNKCTFYIRIDKTELTFPSSVPQETINQQNELYKKMEGKDGTCKFEVNDLMDMLINWKAGNISPGSVSCKLLPSGDSDCTTEGGDFGVAECSGKYFETSL